MVGPGAEWVGSHAGVTTGFSGRQSDSHARGTRLPAFSECRQGLWRTTHYSEPFTAEEIRRIVGFTLEH